MGRSSKTASWITLSFFLGLTSAFATSTGAIPARTIAACEVSAKFIEAKSKLGHVVWIFDRLDSANPPSEACSGMGHSFEVWIWSGSYSSLSHSIVYPVSITEPKPGEEFILRLDFRTVREIPTKTRPETTHVTGWFLGPEKNSMKGRAR
ncbi:MAG: hypothetical protein H7301_09305 [Cryobacterium sp.]|nr:hypothetical protein [Oligoflexia bacterium]